MIKNNFKLTIETPEGTKIDQELVYSLTFKAEDGVVQILPHHMSYMTTVTYSRVLIQFDNESEEKYLCRNAIFTFDNNTNSGRLIAEYCQIESEVTPESVQDYLTYIQKQLAEGKDLSKVQLVYLENEKFAVEQMINS